MSKNNANYGTFDNEIPKYNSTEKMRYINNRIRDDMDILGTPGIFTTSSVGKNEYIDVNNLLYRPAVQNTVRKDYVKEIECCDTHCKIDKYNTDIATKYGFGDEMQTSVRRKDFACYKRTGNRAAGRGIGNLEADSYIRYSRDTRKDMDTISDVEVDKYKFHSHFRNYQDPNHIVFPLPRGGIDTRNLDKYTRVENY
jgi:hypothetical protein